MSRWTLAAAALGTENLGAVVATAIERTALAEAEQLNVGAHR